MGLDPMLQQRSITQVVFTLAEDVLELLKQLIELLLLERGEAIWEWWLAWLLWRMRGGRGGGRCFREVDHFEDAYTLPCVKLKEAQAGGCARHTRALDHLRAQECQSQTPGEHHQGKKGRPQLAMGCDNGQGGLSREGCLPSEAAENS